jgi:nicotinamide phosphoribosyltransferase
VNFRGSDTISGVLAGRRYYHEPMAAYSIPAAEHSTITCWGKDGELDAYRNMLRRFAKPGALVACVSDSYDIYNAVENLWGRALREEVVDSGATIVIRPDSGNPAEVVLKTAILLERAFGAKVNSRGFRVLNNVRIIQGDGINPRSIREILSNLKINGYSADNIAFGMGGALLQQVHRDTQKFAMKCSAVRIDSVWRDAFKDPVTDPGKASKRGRLTLLKSRMNHELMLARRDSEQPFDPEWEDLLQPVWRDGELLRDETLATIRSRADDVKASSDPLLGAM